MRQCAQASIWTFQFVHIDAHTECMNVIDELTFQRSRPGRTAFFLWETDTKTFHISTRSPVLLCVPLRQLIIFQCPTINPQSERARLLPILSTQSRFDKQRKLDRFGFHDSSKKQTLKSIKSGIELSFRSDHRTGGSEEATFWPIWVAAVAAAAVIWDCFRALWEKSGTNERDHIFANTATEKYRETLSPRALLMLAVTLIFYSISNYLFDLSICIFFSLLLSPHLVSFSEWHLRGFSIPHGRWLLGN